MNETDIAKNFRVRLRIARKASGFSSQAQFAKHLGDLGYPMSEAAIARIEIGTRKVTLSDAVAFSDALGCSLEQLLYSTHYTPEPVAMPSGGPA